MSSPKERHYWSQLRAAITAGQWRNEYPVKAYNGSALSWSELFRKFKKHCRGFEDVATVAEQTRLLALLLGAKYKDDDENSEVEDVAAPLSSEREAGNFRQGRLGKVDLDQECVLLPERVEEAKFGYETIKSVQSARFDTIHFALAYYAFALGNPRDCLDHLAKVPELLQFQNHIPNNNDSTRSNGLLAPSTYAPSSTTSFSGSFTSVADLTNAEVRDGRAWAMAETFRSLCLKGMAQELLHPTDLRLALQEYNTALPLFEALRTEFAPKNLPLKSSSTGSTEFTVFSQLRELWRWVERLLWRAIVLSAKVSDIFDNEDSSSAATSPGSNSEAAGSIWLWFGHYTTCSALWPATFRTHHRSAICVLYLRALVLRFGILASTPSPGIAPVYLPPRKSISATASAATTRPSTSLSHTAPNNTSASTTSPTVFQSQMPTPSTWTSVARSVVQDYRAILTASTTFPRAGERNHQVEDFVELCVKVWEAGGAIGEQAGWVIDILTWSQRLTFNSSLVLRHLTRLLYIGSAPYLAKKTLHVYIQVVGKAWEASKHGVGEDKDDDVRWVETLVFGARMLCAEVGGPGFMSSSSFAPNSSMQGALLGDDGSDGIDEVLEACEILDKARWRLDENDKRLLAEVLLAEGIVWSLLAIKGRDPLTRAINFDKAHVCLLRSTQAFPTPSAYYHLALSFARRIPGIHRSSSLVKTESDKKQEGHEHHMTRAIECAGQAVEGAPNDVRCWHLLGLLLSATEKWVAAKEILERGAELDDGDDIEGTEEENKDVDTHGVNGMNRVRSEDADTVTQVKMEAQSLKIPNGVSSSSDASALPKTHRTTTNGTVVPRQDSTSSYITSRSSVATSDVVLLQPYATSLPPSSSLRHPSVELLYPSSNNSDELGPLLPSLSIDQYPPSTSDLFERHLQLRMTQVALMEVMEGPEGAEQGWLEVFAWVAEKRGIPNNANGGATTEASSQPRQSLDDTHFSQTVDGHQQGEAQAAAASTTSFDQGAEQEKAGNTTSSKRLHLGLSKKTSKTDAAPQSPSTLMVPIGIKVSPATPELEPEVQRQLEKVETARSVDSLLEAPDVKEKVRDKEKDKDKEKSQINGFGTAARQKRSLSIDRDNRGDTSKTKKVGQMLKGSVHKGRAGISAVGKKIGHGVARNGVLRRSTSNPDFYAALRPTSYQASSIHSRRRLSSIIHSEDHTPTESPPPPPPPSLPSTSTQQDYKSRSQRSAKENRLLSDLWLMSAATFRRLSKLDQAKGAIQEAEVKDENNPNVWVQLGLYYVEVGMYQHAIDALQKARFISFDDVAAIVHLARLYLDPHVTSKIHTSSNDRSTTSTTPPPPSRVDSSASTTGSLFPVPTNVSPDVDLAAGMLAHATKGRGWDVPEVWYFLAKAYGMQGRKERERETLKVALQFSEKRGVRDISSALGWCT